jgi:hypothetical protein
MTSHAGELNMEEKAAMSAIGDRRKAARFVAGAVNSTAAILAKNPLAASSTSLSSCLRDWTCGIAKMAKISRDRHRQ